MMSGSGGGSSAAATSLGPVVGEAEGSRRAESNAAERVPSSDLAQGQKDPLDAAVEEDKEPSAAAFAQARAQRPMVCGSYAPERPYPIYLRGIVERGFGRGGKELGCPTANLPSKVVGPQSSLTRTGIYFGFARVLAQDPDDPDLEDEGSAVDLASSSSLAGANSGEGAQSMPVGAGEGGHNAYEEDDEYYDDGDEVILGASPVADGFEGQKEWNEERAQRKSRQMSRSSVRSNRSGAAMAMERGAGSSTSSNLASEVGGEDKVIQQPQALADAAVTLKDQQQREAGRLSDQQAQQQQQQQVQPSTAQEERHPRNVSSSSNASTLRKSKKKPRIPIAAQDTRVFPMVMSVGWNPYYQNTAKTAEVHIMHQFPRDFYGLETRVVVLGYIRPEYNYVSVEALKDDIETDKKVAINSLARPHYQDYGTDPFLLASSY